MVEHWTLYQIVLNLNRAGTEGNGLEQDILPPLSTGEYPGNEGSTPTLLKFVDWDVKPKINQLILT